MRAGCKGCTTWRPNDITGAILSLDETRKTAPTPKLEARSLRPCPKSLHRAGG